MSKPLCRHCQEKPVNRCRGLCWHCYYAPGVRGLYPSRNRCGVGFSNHAPLPRRATTAAPGSRAKLAILIARAARNESLFHPHDAQRPLSEVSS